MVDETLPLIKPEWPAPKNVRAVSTTRGGGVSEAPYASLNLGTHVGDLPDHVAENRRRLQDQLNLPSAPCWLNQVHGIQVVDAAATEGVVDADASISRRKDKTCVVMTADCLPLLLCDRAGSVVAAAHAGWRGLLYGVIEATVTEMAVPGSELMAWLGPAIGPDSFEVGVEVREAFLEKDNKAGSAFKPSNLTPDSDRWLANLYTLARRRLAALGVSEVYGGQFCTYSDAERFYSYRRDGVTGRMASLIWLV